MWRTLGISEADWQNTPPAVQTKLLSEFLESHSLKLRTVSHQKQIDSLTQPAAQIKRLSEKIIKQQKQIDSLQKQLAKTNKLTAEVAKLSAEIAELKEKIGTQSETGSRFVERILTVVTTLQQQGRSVLAYLNNACAGEEATIKLNLQAV